MNRMVKNNIKAVSTIVGVILLISMVITALVTVRVWLNSEASEVINEAEYAFDGYMGEWEGGIGDGDDDDNDDDNPPPEMRHYIGNRPPKAFDDFYGTDEDIQLVVIAPGVLENDIDSDADPLTAELQDDVSQGILTLNANGSFEYTSNTNFVGEDTFTYRAFDGLDYSNVATVTITVSPENNPPPDVKIWDNDNPEWTDVFGNGDPIDTNANQNAYVPQIANDSQDRVYVTYYQYDGIATHIYLTRYDGIDVRIWDNDTKSWTLTFTDGDPIDTNTAQNAYKSQITVDSQDHVYVTYYQSDGTATHIYLTRYDGTDVRIWDNDTKSWTDSFGDGDPIDTNADQNAYVPQIAVDSQDRVYVTFQQKFTSVKYHIYLSRY